MKLIINFLCQLDPRLNSELMERVHMNVLHQRRTANHNTKQVKASVTSARFKTLLLKVKRLKNMRNLNTVPQKYLFMKEDK